MDEQLVHAILSELIKYLSISAPDTIASFKNIKTCDLWTCFFGLGLYIRNHLLLPADNELCLLFYQNGIMDRDAMSRVMVEQWHEVLNKF